MSRSSPGGEGSARQYSPLWAELWPSPGFRLSPGGCSQRWTILLGTSRMGSSPRAWLPDPTSGLTKTTALGHKVPLPSTGPGEPGVPLTHTGLPSSLVSLPSPHPSLSSSAPSSKACPSSKAKPSPLKSTCGCRPPSCCWVHSLGALEAQLVQSSLQSGEVITLTPLPSRGRHWGGQVMFHWIAADSGVEI